VRGSTRTELLLISLMLLLMLSGVALWSSIANRQLAAQRARRLNEALVDHLSRNDSAGVERLLRQGADPNTTAHILDGSTPLHLAVLHSNGRCAHLLLQYGARVKVRSRDGWYPLSLAFYRTWGDEEQVIRWLLEAHADVNCTDAFGHTPMQLSGAPGRERLRQMLVGYQRSQHNAEAVR
jgi:ankyrin repeat protein